MKLLELLALCFLVIVVSSSPANRDKRSVYAGSMAGSGFGWPFMPFGVNSDYSYNPNAYRSYYNPPFPFSWFPTGFPPFTPPVFYKPWYEGDNVCTTTKEMDDPATKEYQEWIAELSSDGNHESEKCRGTTSAYTCIKWTMNNGQWKTILSKKECCHGFVNLGNGCQETGSETSQTPGSPGSKTETYIVRNGANSQSSSSSASSSSTNVERMPIQ